MPNPFMLRVKKLYYRWNSNKVLNASTEPQPLTIDSGRIVRAVQVEETKPKTVEQRRAVSPFREPETNRSADPVERVKKGKARDVSPGKFITRLIDYRQRDSENYYA